MQDWEDPGSGQFNVRSKDYLRNKKKELSEAAIYKCASPLQMLLLHLTPVLILALLLITGSCYQQMSLTLVLTAECLQSTLPVCICKHAWRSLP